MTRAKRKPPELQALYRGIAKDLSGDNGRKWTSRPVDSDGCYRFAAELMSDDGREIHCSYDDYKDRVSVSGHWPTTANRQYFAQCYNGEHNPEITVAAKRTAASVAKDIRSRFMAPFLVRWDQIAKRVAEHNEYEANKDRVQAKLLDLIEGATKSQGRDGIWAPSPYGEIRPSGDDVCFGGMMHLPFDVAADVIAVIEAWRAKGGDR